MSELDAVAEAICNARHGDWNSDSWNITYGSGRDPYRHEAQAAIDVLRPTVTTVEQLDALPDGAVIHPLESKTVASIEKRCGVWWPSGGSGPIPGTHLPNAVPALVLWRPDPAVDRG